MASCHAPDGQPPTANDAIPFKGFDGVCGTSGGKPTARGEKGADEALVETDEKNQEAPQSLRTTLTYITLLSKEAGALQQCDNPLAQFSEGQVLGPHSGCDDQIVPCYEITRLHNGL